MIQPIYISPDGAITLYHADALEILPQLATGSVDAVITDPPYSSGGFTRSDRTQSTNSKYTQSGADQSRPDFAGDSRSQRGWQHWCALWLTQCRRLVRPAGYCLTFTDWRQIACAMDAMEAGGFIHRGTIGWDKGRGARAAHTGYFRAQCEFILWGTHGVSRAATHGGPFDGCFKFPTLQKDKHHVTGKPTPLMEELVRIVPPGAMILDPFAGSATTAVACIRQGRRFIGIEQSPEYIAIAIDRIEKELAAQPPRGAVPIPTAEAA